MMLSTLSVFLSVFFTSAITVTAASLPSGVVIIVPPNSTVVTEDVAFGASFAPSIDPSTFGYSSRIQIALTYPNGTQSPSSTVHDRACSDTLPSTLGGFNLGGLNFSQRVVPDTPGVYTIDVSVRFGFPPAGSKCADGNEEFQFRNSSASFQVLPRPADASSILIGTAFGLVTQTFAQPTGAVEGGNATTTGTSGDANTTFTNGTSGSAPTTTPTGAARAVGVPVGLAAACAGGALAVSMW
ncbi:hypothetical protein BDZ94DRAFT_1266071 [Collybia nuda]|uniref:Uncharacterized protein n=1 Tax=Collybia nuda TaxID=64659 RepID=A0A9P5Y2S6_9AGAR|nr:hypothetical protein BDZ94DRAFT_1266071 [Collybia nuda]